MGEPKNHHLVDFGLLGRVLEPPSQLFLSFETPGSLKQIKKVPGTLVNNLQNWSRSFRKFGTDFPQVMKIRLIFFLKSLDTTSMSSGKKLQWKSSEIWKHINVETKKPVSQQPRNQETQQKQETKKPKTKKPRNFSSKGIPWTPQHIDSHPCARPHSWGTQKIFNRVWHRDQVM